MLNLTRAACAFAALTMATLALADEGMWTYDNFPTAKMKAKYGWAPDAAWLEHARLAPSGSPWKGDRRCWRGVVELEAPLTRGFPPLSHHVSLHPFTFAWVEGSTRANVERR